MRDLLVHFYRFYSIIGHLIFLKYLMNNIFKVINSRDKMKDGSIYPSMNGSIYPSSNDLLLKNVYIVLTSVHKIQFAYFKSQPYTSQKPNKIDSLI